MPDRSWPLLCAVAVSAPLLVACGAATHDAPATAAVDAPASDPASSDPGATVNFQAPQSAFSVEIPVAWKRVPSGGTNVLTVVDPVNRIRCFETLAPSAIQERTREEIRPYLSGPGVRSFWNSVFAAEREVAYQEVGTRENGGWPVSHAVAQTVNADGVRVEYSGVATLFEGTAYILLCSAPPDRSPEAHASIERFLASFKAGLTL